MPLRPIRINNRVLAAHLIWTGYGHWLPNDPRGSGSTLVQSRPLQPLGPVHTGRKPRQPPAADVKAFYRNARPRLLHETLWFTPKHRDVIGPAVGSVVAQEGYTVWALGSAQSRARRDPHAPRRVAGDAPPHRDGHPGGALGPQLSAGGASGVVGADVQSLFEVGRCGATHHSVRERESGKRRIVAAAMGLRERV